MANWQTLVSRLLIFPFFILAFDFSFAASFSGRRMAMNSGLRSCASKLLNSSASIAPKSACRGVHSTSIKQMGGGGHGHDEPYYLHAKHMYNLDRMKNQKLTMTLGVFTAFSMGVGLPICAVIHQQRRAASA